MTEQCWRPAQCLWALAILLVASNNAPLWAEQERFSAGQNVAPVYEGWVRTPDGSFDFYFGYMNRNWIDEPSVPIGPNNFFSPGSSDRGQPSYFYPRRHMTGFSVNVPADWGPTEELVWTLTVNGKTDAAFAWLKPEWEFDSLTIARNFGIQYGRTPEEIYENQPPSIKINPVQSVTLSEIMTLTASVGDDGLPVSKTSPFATSELGTRRGLATLSAPPPPVNIPMYRTPRVPRNELSVLWVVHRGPATVVFEPKGYQVVKGEDEDAARKSGTTVTTASFTEPGTYVLRAIAADGVARTATDVTVTVTGASSQF